MSRKVEAMNKSTLETFLRKLLNGVHISPHFLQRPDRRVNKKADKDVRRLQAHDEVAGGKICQVGRNVKSGIHLAAPKGKGNCVGDSLDERASYARPRAINQGAQPQEQSHRD